MDALNRDEIRSLLAAAKMRSVRDWLMILVAFLHGLRASEVISLREDNIADGHITVRRLKGSLKTTQPLLTSEDPLFDERQALLDLWKKSRRGAKLFPVSRWTFGRRMKVYCEAAGIPAHKAHPHVLKHSTAMQAIRTAGIEHVRQYLGHKSGASTMQYLRVSDEDASQAVADALGLGKAT